MRVTWRASSTPRTTMRLIRATTQQRRISLECFVLPSAPESTVEVVEEMHPMCQQVKEEVEEDITVVPMEEQSWTGSFRRSPHPRITVGGLNLLTGFVKLILGHPSIGQFKDYGGGSFSKDCCRSMLAMLDTDKSGRLNLAEFEVLMGDLYKWKAAFKQYDRNGVGRLNVSELREALGSAGYQLNNRVLNALVHRYGSRDGTMAFDDFIMCAVRIRTMIEAFKTRDREGNQQASFTLDDWVETTMYS